MVSGHGGKFCASASRSVPKGFGIGNFGPILLVKANYPAFSYTSSSQIRGTQRRGKVVPVSI